MLLTVLLVMILLALAFEFINGFHDTANSIATIVGTKVLTPRQAIMLAATCDLAGALMGSDVAKTITSGVIDAGVVGQGMIQYLVICALFGGIVWNLITWYFGIPSSSTHALVGGMIGATVGVTQGNWGALIWSTTDAVTGKHIGIYHKVVLPMFTSPFCGFIGGFLLMAILMALLSRAKPARVNSVFGKLQIVSSAGMGIAHGFNDAQKVMGIITLGLVAGTTSGAFDALPAWLHSIVYTPKVEGGNVPAVWVKVLCATVMACGTAMGGWRIIKTLGHKMVKLQPIHGFAAEATAASVLGIAGAMGMPVSTTHAITTSIMGVGCTKRFNALKFSLVEKILWAWVLTIPCAGLVAYGVARLAKLVGFIPS